ncbi:unnamed protein product, partial [Schistosoma curassoni]|uniref:Transposase n=1 Tax=Schistosoma curassoni TaxID=6186 RepID=A0A183JQN1_9TREM
MGKVLRGTPGRPAPMNPPDIVAWMSIHQRLKKSEWSSEKSRA